MKKIILAALICTIILLALPSCQKEHHCMVCTTDALGNDTTICSGNIPSTVHNCVQK